MSYWEILGRGKRGLLQFLIPNRQAVRVAWEGIFNATIRQTGTERPRSFHQTLLNPWASPKPPRLLPLTRERQTLAKLTLLRMHLPGVILHPM